MPLAAIAEVQGSDASGGQTAPRKPSFRRSHPFLRMPPFARLPNGLRGTVWPQTVSGIQVGTTAYMAPQAESCFFGVQVGHGDSGDWRLVTDDPPVSLEPPVSGECC